MRGNAPPRVRVGPVMPGGDSPLHQTRTLVLRAAACRATLILHDAAAVDDALVRRAAAALSALAVAGDR